MSNTGRLIHVRVKRRRKTCRGTIITVVMVVTKFIPKRKVFKKKAKVKKKK